MFTWNDPYVLAVLLGFVAIGLFYFDQKQKKENPPTMSYVKVFTLVTGLIFGYNYFVDNNLNTISTVPTEQIVTEIAKPILETVSPTLPIVSNTLSGMYSNLKIKEGPPNF